MSTTLAPDKTRATIAVLAAIAILLSPIAFGIVIVILVAGAYGWWRCRHYVEESPTEDFAYDIPRWIGMAFAVIFFVLLIGLPFARIILDVDVSSDIRQLLS